jgi:hypothetical protein
MKLFEEIFNSSLAGKTIIADEVIDRDKIKAHIAFELKKIRPEFEKLLHSDPELLKQLDELDRTLRNY